MSIHIIITLSPDAAAFLSGSRVRVPRTVGEDPARESEARDREAGESDIETHNGTRIFASLTFTTCDRTACVCVCVTVRNRYTVVFEPV